MRNNSTCGTDTVLKQIILHVELFALTLLLRRDNGYIILNSELNGCYSTLFVIFVYVL